MLLTEYDYDTDIAVQRQEAYEDGMEQGIAQGSHQKAIETAKNMLKDNLDIQTILIFHAKPQPMQKKTGVHNFARFTRTKELCKNKLNQKKLCKAKKTNCSATV